MLIYTINYPVSLKKSYVLKPSNQHVLITSYMTIRDLWWHSKYTIVVVQKHYHRIYGK